MLPKDFPQLMRGVLALLLVASTVASYMAQGSAPDGLIGLTGVAVTFYFTQT